MSRLKLQKHTFQDTAFLLALSSFFLLFRLGSGSLASWDEAIYACVAKGIIQSGDWFRLTLVGAPWTDKPPLAVWVTAFFYKIFGINEFAARLFSALCGIGTVLVTYFLGRKLLGRWVGFLGALVLLSSSHYIHYVRFGMTDGPLTFFLTLALYLFWLGYEKNRFLIFSGVAIGLAIMTKSFAGLLIFPIVWIYCAWAEEFEILARSSYWIGVMIAVAIALPWNIFEMVINRGQYMNEAWLKHLSRAWTSLEGHQGNFYYYIRIMVNKYHPWVLVAIVSAPFFLFKAIKERTSEIIFLTVWMVFIFGLVTLMQTKIDWYILPVYPALSLSVGYLLAKIFKEDQKHFVRLMFIVIMALHVPYSHIFDYDYSRDLKGIAPLVRQSVPPKQILYLYNYHEVNAVSFYMDRQGAYLDSPETFVSEVKNKNEIFCLIHGQHLKLFEKRLPELGLSIQGSFEDLYLLSKHAKGAGSR